MVIRKSNSTLFPIDSFMVQTMNMFFPGEFPVHALPPIMQAAVFDLVAKTQSPLAIVVSAVIASAGLAAQAEADASRPNCKPSPIGPFIVVLASSGERKSSVTKRAFAAHAKFEGIVQQQMDQQIAGFEASSMEWAIVLASIRADMKKATKKGQSTDALLSDLKAHLMKQPKRPLTPNVTFSDVTPEALAKSMTSKWPSVGLISDEGDGLLNGRAMQHMHLLTQAWDGDPLHIDRADGSVEPVADPRMTMLAMIQPELFAKFMRRKGKEAHDLGLFARTLITYPVSTQGRRYNDPAGGLVATDGLEAFDARIFQILTKVWSSGRGGNFERQTIAFSKEASVHWIKLGNWVESQCVPDGLYGRTTAYASKIADNVARMAALFAYFDGDRFEISLEDVQRAEAVVGFYSKEHLRLFFPPPLVPMAPAQVDAYALQAWLAKRVISQGSFRFYRRAVRQNGPLRCKDRLVAALHWLSSEGKVALQNHGRSVVIDCHPGFFAPGTV